MNRGDVSSVVVLLVVGLVVAVAGALAVRAIGRRRDFGTPTDKATFATLHRASRAASHLREGLTPEGCSRASRALRGLLGTPAIAITNGEQTLTWEGAGSPHAGEAVLHAREALATGRVTVLGPDAISCSDASCPVHSAVVVPLIIEDRVVGCLIAYASSTDAGLVRATVEVAGWVSTQLELAELDRSRTRAVEAELKALRAQISPHFVYNSLAAIASFVRTDPERARELLLEFADFTRYSFRSAGDFTTLADELRNVERYLVLEQARFGTRLHVQLLVAPEVLSVNVPVLAVQPLVENAVRHGLERKDGVGHIVLSAEDQGAEAVIWVEDDGVGSEPDLIRQVLAGDSETDSVGLGNVDARLRQVYGDDHGLVVETAPGAGTRVSFRVPKFHSDLA